MDEPHYKLLQPEKVHQNSTCDCDRGTPDEEASPQWRPKRSGWQPSTLALLLLTALQSLVLIFVLSNLLHTNGTYETGFATDFDDVKPHIFLEERQFSSGLHIGDNESVHLAEAKPGETAYVGRNLEEVNKAWEELFGRRYFRLSESEVDELNGDEPSLPGLQPLVGFQSHTGRTGVFAGVEVMHSLHCLDTLRRYINGQWDHVGHGAHEGGGMRIHIDHCVDHLRQGIMCSADLTPVTLKPLFSGDKKNPTDVRFVGETERRHTCRNFEAIREWALTRDWFKS